MSFTVRCYNKHQDATYVYRCENYIDPETGKRKSRRQCIGKLDENGEVVPTGSRGRKRKADDSSTQQNPRESEQVLRSEIRKEIQEEYRDMVFNLQTQISELKKEIRRKDSALASIAHTMAAYQSEAQNSNDR